MIARPSIIRMPIGILAGLVFAGAALAAPVKDSAKLAGCIDKATLQFSIADAQCAGRPPGAFEQCKLAAVQAYSQAINACAAEDAALRRGPLTASPGKRPLLQSR